MTLPASACCANCEHFTDLKSCSLNPIHVPVTPDHFCGQYEGKELPKTNMGVPHKVTDRQIYELMISPEWEDADVGFFPKQVRFMAEKFGVSKRTIEERLKRMASRKMIEIRLGAVPGSNLGKRWAHALLDPQSNFIPWKEAWSQEESGKWGWGDIAPVFRDLKDIPALRYSEIAKAAPRMGRGAFDRVMRDAVRDGKLVKNPDGSYQLAPQAP